MIMKLLNSRLPCLPLLAAALFSLASNAWALPRHHPANPRGIADPRGAFDPRGVADPRGVFDPRGPFDPRNPARYMYGLPTGYAVRVYSGVNYYYCSGTYYYVYIINGQNVYVRCTVVRGVPVIPPRPY